MQHVARVAYEASSDFIRATSEVPVPEEVCTIITSEMADDRALVIIPNDRVREALCHHLNRWSVPYDMGKTLAHAMVAAKKSDAEMRERNAVPGQITIVIADIDRNQIPAWVLASTGVRFIFLCSDSHRRLLIRDPATHWYSACQNYTLVNKPVKRATLWAALRSRGQVTEPPTTLSIERTQTHFSFRRKHASLDSLRPAPQRTTEGMPRILMAEVRVACEPACCIHHLLSRPSPPITPVP